MININILEFWKKEHDRTLLQQAEDKLKQKKSEAEQAGIEIDEWRRKWNESIRKKQEADSAARNAVDELQSQLRRTQIQYIYVTGVDAQSTNQQVNICLHFFYDYLS